jgi:hypothetical protein
MRTLRTMRTLITSLALGLGALGGAGAQTPHRLPRAVTTDTAATTNAVTVQNDRKVPVTLYLEQGMFDRRLGEVPARSTATLPLPAWAVRGREEVRLFAHPEGELGDLATETLRLAPPGRLAMLIPPWGAVAAPSDTMSAVIPPDELADATVTVDNPRAMAVTVYAEQGDFDVRLGRVPAHDRVTLRFPRSVVLPGDDIQLFVHPDGGPDLSSETLHVTRGEHLGLRVAPD